jgi:Fe(3+) dicitrate transport protein
MAQHHFALKTLVVSLGTAFASNLLAAEPTTTQLPRIDVIGPVIDPNTRASHKQPGSVATVSREQLQLMQPLSTQDALKSVPGVNVKDEDTTAVVANIGLRGLNPTRSQKVLVLEDGVPIAPGLFTKNESYFNPPISRMERIEVLKGAASLRYGPSTIGGVINYQTKQPQDDVALTGTIGSDGYRSYELEAGGSAPSGDAFGGISLIKASADGFQKKGFDMNDVMVKGGMAIGDHQWVSAKFTHYDNEANISYVGLRPNEYEAEVRYNPAPDDYFITERNAFDLNHELQIRPGMKLNTLVYWNQLDRDYWRVDIDSKSADGTLFKDTNRGRNRSFEMLGVDSRLTLNHNSFGIQNETETGLRLHNESLSNRVVSGTSPTARTGNITSDKTEQANSVALYAQNRFVLNDRWAITPGVRVESYQQSLKDEISGTKGNTSNTEVMPGVGTTWQIIPSLQLFAGAYQAFAPALTATAISNDGEDQKLEAERSTNFELGLRGASNRLSYELTAFHMDFENQIINAAVSSGYDKSNGGKTLHQGVEGALGYDFDNGFSLDANATYVTDASFIGNRYDSSGSLLIEDGNRIPYTPELVANLSLGYENSGLKTALNLQHVGTQYTDDQNTEALNETGTAGKLDAHTTLNFNAHYTLNKQLSVFGSVRNLTDERYIASLRDGIYAGTPRTYEIGARYQF